MRLSFELLVRSGRSANKTEGLCVSLNLISTFDTQRARTNPCFSFPVFMAKKWDFGALHLCHNNMALNPATPGWRSTHVCKHTRFAITALCAYKSLRNITDKDDLNVRCKVDDKYQLFTLWGYDIMDSEYLQKSLNDKPSLPIPQEITNWDC